LDQGLKDDAEVDIDMAGDESGPADGDEGDREDMDMVRPISDPDLGRMATAGTATATGGTDSDTKGTATATGGTDSDTKGTATAIGRADSDTAGTATAIGRADTDTAGSATDFTQGSPPKGPQMFDFFQKALSMEYAKISDQERKEYEKKALEWRKQGPDQEEKNRFAHNLLPVCI
jgi:hypothetical protein